jgi:hypothetical protein
MDSEQIDNMIKKQRKAEKNGDKLKTKSKKEPIDKPKRLKLKIIDKEPLPQVVPS